MGIPGTIKLSSTLASEMGTLGGTENHPEKGRVSRSTNTHIRPPPRSHGAGFRPEGFQLWVCTHILCGPCHPPLWNLPHLLCAEPKPPRPRPLSDSTRPRPSDSRPAQGPRPEAPPSRAPETPQRMPVRDRDVTRASLVRVAVFARSRSRVAAVSWCVAVAVLVSLPARAAPCTTAAARSGTGPLRERSSWRACGPTPTANSSAKRWLTGR